MFYQMIVACAITVPCAVAADPHELKAEVKRDLTGPRQGEVSGKVEFVPKDPEKTPEIYRLDKHTFPYVQKLKYDLKYSEIEVYSLTFPSPVKTGHEPNNTVHAEYFRPKGAGKFPAVVVLDIMDGKQLVSRSQALWLAQHKVAALCVTMAYYGQRRSPDCPERFLSRDIEKSVANVKQTVLDCRRAIAWLEQQREIDSSKMGVLGTSLGSFVGGLVGAVEPKIRSVSLCLGGAGLVDSFLDHPLLLWMVPFLNFSGLNYDRLRKMIDPVDTLTYSDTLKSKRVYLFGALQDDMVPPVALRRLWEGIGKPPITWVDATHIGAAFYMFQMMREVTTHVKE